MARPARGRPQPHPEHFEPPPPQIYGYGSPRILRLGAKGGSAVADKVLRTAFGLSAGLGIGAQVFLGMPETLVFTRQNIVNLPLLNFGMLGFVGGLLLSPVALLLTRRRPWPRYLMRTAFCFGFACAAFLD